VFPYSSTSSTCQSCGPPVEIVVDDASADFLFQFGDGASQVRGWHFENIWFRPQTDAGATGVGTFEADTGATTRSFTFERCWFTQFGSEAFRSSDATDESLVQDQEFINCLFRSNSATSTVGIQCELEGCYIVSEVSGGEIDTYQGSSVESLQGLNNTAGADVITIGWGTTCNVKDIESGVNGGGGAGVVVSAAQYQPAYLTGTIQGMDNGVKVASGALVSDATIHNAQTNAYTFEGSGGAHNGSRIYAGNLSPSGGVSVTNTPQRMRVIFATEQSNLSAGTLPPGGIAMDNNRGGTGATAYVYADRSGTSYYVDMSTL